MKLIRLVLSDLHLGSGVEKGRLNPHEDFFHDEGFSELLAHYDGLAGDETELELILNGDIFDLLKIKIDGIWPTEITEEIAERKLRQCLDGHPRFVLAIRRFLGRARRSLVYLPGNHDLDMWFPGPQELFKRYVAPGDSAARVRFITASDTYYLPEGIQIRHGHQLERIHRVDYSRLLRKRSDGAEILDLPYGSLWILEVLNPAKEERHNVDRIQPLRLFLLGSLLFDPRFGVKFMLRATIHFLRHRIFALRAWSQRLRSLPRILREEVIAIRGFDDAATRSLQKLRGVHTLIVGHSHAPRFRLLEGNRILLNTGTWMKMINLDLQHLGQDSGLTYALIEYSDDGDPRPKLMRWYGTRKACENIPYAH
ncbi:MAG: metallophosphoesterase [Myxococcales bacterium]|nr:metallophosphoesterase [Myxococcales bacterium]MDD9965701.1 metallophosphoesterase [Myxococcales bacterium]